MADEPKGTEEEAEVTPEAAAEEKPKPARKPRAKKAAAEPKAEATEAVAAGEDEAPAEEKPKPARKPRAKKAAEEPKAEEKAEEAKPAAKPARRSRREAPERVVVRAHAKYVRTSARKARLVCDHIRGKDVGEARAILLHTNRQVAEAWSKLLESAVANAEHNHSLDGEDLYVKAVHADEGPTIKRFRPRAMGRATRIRKRTSHLTILLTPKE
jgi:ribosomal protein L22